MMMFAKGDVVQVKSGGPVMTVEDFSQTAAGGQRPRGARRWLAGVIRRTPVAWCVWFDENDQKRDSFRIDVLVKYEEGKVKTRELRRG